MKCQKKQAENLKLKTKIGTVTISRNRSAMLTLGLALSGPIQVVDISKNWNGWITGFSASIFVLGTLIGTGCWHMDQSELRKLKKELKK